jgi:hypothetical protein
MEAFKELSKMPCIQGTIEGFSNSYTKTKKFHPFARNYYSK